MAGPFRSLVFLGIWKLGLWPGRRAPLTVRASTCTLRRRSVPSCSGITPSPHPGWSPFWLAVAEVAVKFLGGSPPSGWRSSVSVHSECFFPTALGLWAIFGRRARSTGDVAGTITAALHTHTHTLHSSPSLRHCENDVRVLLHYCKTLPSLCLHARKSAPPNGRLGHCTRLLSGCCQTGWNLFNLI